MHGRMSAGMYKSAVSPPFTSSLGGVPIKAEVCMMAGIRHGQEATGAGLGPGCTEVEEDTEVAAEVGMSTQVINNNSAYLFEFVGYRC